MKKKFLTYGKKSLSVFLAVLMLMTCWVFFPGEHNHASAVEADNVAAYNLSLVSGLSNINTAVTTTTGSFDKDGDYVSATNYAEIYKNVLYSPQTLSADAAAKVGQSGLSDNPALDSIRWYHPVTTLIYDGVTTPQFGIAMAVDAYNKCRVRTYSSWISGGNNGLTFGNTYWRASDTQLNFMWNYFAHASGNNSMAVTTNGTVGSAWDDINVSTAGDDFYYANTIQFTGSMGDTEFLRTITPTWSWKGNQRSQGSGSTYTYSAASTKSIYVINYKTVKAAMEQANTWLAAIKANPGKYSTRSVVDFVDMFNKLAACRPNNYVNSTTNNPGGYNTAATTAMTAYNSFKLEERKYDVQAENLFSFADWYYSKSNSAGGANGYSADVDKGTIYIASYNSSGEVVTSHSSQGTRNQNNYAIPVEGGKEYTVEWTTACGSIGDIPTVQSSEVFLFFYDENNSSFDTWANFHISGSPSGKNSGTVTAPANAKYMELRVDFNNNYYAGNMTFSNIKVYKAERATEIARADWTSGLDIRKVYSYNSAVGTLDTPARKGYAFDGWQVDSDFDGTPDFDVTSDNLIQLSWPLYAKWTIKSLDIGYDNLFSVSDWYYATNGAKTNQGGAITADIENGTISIENPAGANQDNNYVPWDYDIAVKPNTEYVFVFDADIQSGVAENGVQFHLFENASTDATSWIQFPNSPYLYTLGKTTGNTLTFTTSATTTNINIRLGTVKATGVTNTFSNIGLYEKADYDAYVKNYSKIREPFKVGDTTAFMIPTRDGWAFDGWYTADGTKIENVTGLYESDTVYAQWIKLHTVTFKNYDGTVLKTEKLKSGSATAPANPIRRPDANYEYTFAGWDKDFSNVTGDITVTAQYNEVEHSGVKVVLNTPATCTTPGLVTKSCSCGYVWSGIIEDDTGTYPALGHEYDTAKGAKVAGGTSTGVDGVHSVQCARYDVCGSTTTAAHNFQLDANQSASDATCVKPGETYYICACNQKKTETGTINPDNHVNTEIRDAKDATCLEDGYTGDTWCKDCNKKIKDGTVIAKLGHSFTKYVYNEGTAKCEVDGTETAKCDRCDVTETRTSTGTALQHNWENKEDYLKSAANCTDDEVYYKKCSLCGISSETKTGETWTKTGTKWNHNFSGDYVTNNNGTHVQKCVNEDCTATGNQQNCDYNAWTTDNASTHSHTCKNCSYTPAATAHEWSDWSQASTNTGDAAGQMTRSCTVCGRVETENCEYDSVHTEATCTTAGYTTYTCKDANCKHAYTVWHKDTEPAKGHNYTGEYNCDEATDKHQQLCANGCGTYGVDGVADAWAECTFTYENTEAGKHTAACVCDNSEVQDCTGGTATCVDLAVCEKCGEEYGTLADHVYTGKNYVEKATDATCTANETYYYDCIICNKSGKEANSGTYEKPDSMLPHTYTGNTWYDGAELAEEAKCEENEEYYVYCIDCKKSSKGTDEEETFEKDGTATDHKWGALVSGENGTHSYTCQNEGCTEIKTENCADWKMQSGVAPSTCLDKGYTVYECEVCAYNWKDNYTDALGHSYTGEGHDGKPVRVLSEEYKRSVKTCTEPETYWYRCDRCDVSAETGATYTDETESNYYWSNGSAAGHDMQKLVDTNDLSKNRKSEATCTQAAVYYYSCATCGEQDTTQTFTYKSALGHDWKEVEDAKYLATPADCVNDATYYYECSRCTESGKDITGATWTKANSKSGHDFDHEDGYKAAVGATCTTDGNLEYWHCEVCDKYFSDKDATKEIEDVVIDHLGHDWEAVAYKAPTCEEAGYSNHNACSRCDATMNKTEYAATGHKFTGAYWCDTVYNYHSKKCTNDDCTATGIVDAEGNHIKYEVIYDIDVEIKGGEACIFTGEYVNETDENGIHSHALKCVCGNETSEVCVDSEPETVAPTCTEDGYTEYTCETCGYVWQVAGDPAKDHDYTDAEWTSNGDGTHSRACKNGCGEVQTEDCATDTPATTCGGKNVCDTCEEEFGNAIPHSFTNYVYDEDSATCTVDGTKTAVCDYCGEAKDTITAEGTATDHNMTLYIYDVSEWDGMPENFDKDSIKEPTCKNEGRSISFCQNKGCDEHKIRVVAADKTKHIWETDENGEEKWTVVSGDCGTGVTFKCICTACGDSKTKIETVEHQWETQLYIPPTCVNNGCEELKCTVCGFEKDVYYPEDESLGATGDHVYGEAVVVAPTCTAKGYTIEICKVCRYENITNETDVIAHVTETVEALAPSCETAGYYSYEKCTVCKTEIDKKVIPATGHNDDGEGKCSECDRVLYETDDGEGSCGCICHKEGWFMKLIYKVINFFWKLFRISKSCDCGNVHW